MARAKTEKISYEELEGLMRDVVKEVVAELEKLLASKTDISDYADRMMARLDSIDRHFLELKGEMRSLRIMYEFWAERHLSPELIDEFLREQEKKREFKNKKIEA